MKVLSITAPMLAKAAPVLAEPPVEVMHFWTSGGDAANTALQARIASGNPPAAMLMLGQNGIDWANEGMLGNSLSLFTQTDPDLIKGQDVLASAIMDPAVQVAFSQSKGAIPARTDIDLSAMDACAQTTSAALAANDAGGTAVPTFAGTHTANDAVVAAAADAITAFFNSDQTPEEAAIALADAIAAAR